MRKSMQKEAGITSDSSAAMNPEYSEIAALAYQLWNDRGCPIGSAAKDWFQAEEELKRRNEVSAASA